MPVSSTPFQLDIRSFGNKALIHSISCKWHTSIKEIKDNLHEVLNILPSRLHLYFGASAKPLRNGARLLDLGIDQAGYCLHLELVSSVAFDASNAALVPMREAFDDSACKQMLTQVSMGLRLHKPTSTDVLDCTGGVYFMKDPKGAKVAVFKPCDEEQGMPNNSKGHSGNGERGLRPYFTPGYGHIRETAAYLFDFENFAQVPATTIAHCESPVFSYPRGKGGYRNLCPKVGSLQFFVRSATDTFEDISPSLISTFEMQKIALLDMRLLNSDRNASNILLVPKPYHKQVITAGRRNSRTNSVGSCNSEHDGDVDFCDVEFIDEDSSSPAPGSIYQQSKDQYELIPIDHGYCLPTKLRINEWDWSWLYTSHMTKDVDPEIKRYMNSIDIDELIGNVSSQVELHSDTIFLLRVAHKVILAGIAAGLNLRRIAELICRLDEDKPSPLENLIEIAEDNAFQTIESRIDANFFEQKNSFYSKPQHRLSQGGSGKKLSVGLKREKLSRMNTERITPTTERVVTTADARRRNPQFGISSTGGARGDRLTLPWEKTVEPFKHSDLSSSQLSNGSSPGKQELGSPTLRRIVESEADLESMAARRASSSSINSPSRPLPSPLKMALARVSAADAEKQVQLSPSGSVGYFVEDLSDADHAISSGPSTPIALIRKSAEMASESGEHYTPGLSLVQPSYPFAGKPLMYMQSLDPTTLSGSGKHTILASSKDNSSSENFSRQQSGASGVSGITTDGDEETFRQTSYLSTFQKSSGDKLNLFAGVPCAPEPLICDSLSRANSHEDDKDITTSEELLHDHDSPSEAAVRFGSMRNPTFTFAEAHSGNLNGGHVSDDEQSLSPGHMKRSSRMQTFSPNDGPIPAANIASRAAISGASIVHHADDLRVKSGGSNISDVSRASRQTVLGRELRTVTAEPFSPFSQSSSTPTSNVSVATQYKMSYTPGPATCGGMFVAGNDPEIEPRRSSTLTSGGGSSSEDADHTDGGFDSDNDNNNKKQGKTHKTRHSFMVGNGFAGGGKRSHEIDAVVSTTFKAPKEVANPAQPSSNLSQTMNFGGTLPSPFDIPGPVAIARAISFGAFSNAIPKNENSESDKPGRQLSRLKKEKRRLAARSTEFQELRSNFALTAVHSLIAKASGKRSPGMNGRFDL